MEVVTVSKNELIELIENAVTKALRAERDTPKLLTVSEVASIINMSEKFVRKHRFELGGQKIGRSIRFPRIKVNEYLQTKRHFNNKDK